MPVDALSPLRWYGKSSIRHEIVRLMPPHGIYCEPFFGGGSVGLARLGSGMPGYQVVIGDSDPSLVAFWVAVASGSLVGQPAPAPTEHTFIQACSRLSWGPLEDTYEHGWAYLARNRLSYDGLGRCYSADGARYWYTAVGRLMTSHLLLRSSQITCGDWSVVTAGITHERASLTYLDPPYPEWVVNDPKMYPNRMSMEGHLKLLNWALTCRGAVMISGYRCRLYDRLLRRWRRIEITVPCRSVRRGNRTEVIWYRGPKSR